jgi:hypothetical protein
LNHFKLGFSGTITNREGRGTVKNSRFNEEQIIAILKQSEGGRRPVTYAGTGTSVGRALD